MTETCWSRTAKKLRGARIRVEAIILRHATNAVCNLFADALMKDLYYREWPHRVLVKLGLKLHERKRAADFVFLLGKAAKRPSVHPGLYIS